MKQLSCILIKWSPTRRFSSPPTKPPSPIPLVYLSPGYKPRPESYNDSVFRSAAPFTGSRIKHSTLAKPSGQVWSSFRTPNWSNKKDKLNRGSPFHPLSSRFSVIDPTNFRWPVNTKRGAAGFQPDHLDVCTSMTGGDGDNDTNTWSSLSHALFKVWLRRVYYFWPTRGEFKLWLEYS